MNRHIIVTSRKHIDELANGSPKQLSLYAVGKEVSVKPLSDFHEAAVLKFQMFQPKYTMRG